MALARSQGDDAADIVNGLCDHIMREVEGIAGESVDIDGLLAALANIGTSEEVESRHTVEEPESSRFHATTGSAAPPPLQPSSVLPPTKQRSW